MSWMNAIPHSAIIHLLCNIVDLVLHVPIIYATGHSLEPQLYMPLGVIKFVTTMVTMVTSS